MRLIGLSAPRFRGAQLCTVSMTTVFTIGYEGRTQEEFIGLLSGSGVDTVVDVRLTPISRKKGFSKTALREGLESHGIRYLHTRELGNPKEIRRSTPDPAECIAKYASYMTDNWDMALEDVLEEIEERTVALLCFEHDSHHCHRSVVATELLKRVKKSRVVDLE